MSPLIVPSWKSYPTRGKAVVKGILRVNGEDETAKGAIRGVIEQRYKFPQGIGPFFGPDRDEPAIDRIPPVPRFSGIQ